MKMEYKVVYNYAYPTDKRFLFIRLPDTYFYSIDFYSHEQGSITMLENNILEENYMEDLDDLSIEVNETLMDMIFSSDTDKFMALILIIDKFMDQHELTDLGFLKKKLISNLSTKEMINIVL